MTARPLIPPTLVLCCALAGCDALKPKSSPTTAEKVESVAPVDEQLEYGAPWPSGRIRPQVAFVQFAVYATGHSPEQMANVAKEVIGADYPALSVRPEMPDQPSPGDVVLDTPPIAEYAPPDEDSLRHFGVGFSKDDAARVAKLDGVVIVNVVVDGDEREQLHRNALGLTSTLTKKLDGYAWDESTRQIFTLDSWQTRAKEDPYTPEGMTAHFTIHVYRDGEYHRICSLGLEKFGLPNIIVEQVPTVVSRSMVNVLNATAKTFAKAPTVGPNGTLSLDTTDLISDLVGDQPHVATLSLVEARPEAGDPSGPLVEIAFPGPKNSLHERQVSLLDALLGSSDAITYEDHDEELLAAIERSKAKLLALKPTFADGIPEMERLSVKGPFDAPDGSREWMWIAVQSWDGTKLRGILDNDPFNIPDLQAGAKVEVDESLVFDFIYMKKDGTELRGEATALLLDRQAQREN